MASLPGDVKWYCKAFPDCHRAVKILKAHVPLMKTPIISILYHRLAADLVGPIYRTKFGFHYISKGYVCGENDSHMLFPSKRLMLSQWPRD